MNQEPQAIEVEIVAIDGIAPPVKVENQASSSPHSSERGRPQWQQWGGRVRQLDSRWWPLWVILGVIVVFLLLTVGLVLGIVFMMFRILRGIVRALLP
jgi:hypothetical protein